MLGTNCLLVVVSFIARVGSLQQTTTSSLITSNLIYPSHFEYRGAFRLPEYAANPGFGWEWGGTGMTYYPDGDPSGPSDGYPGSLYGIGHDHTKYVSEISIPVPVVSRNLSALNTAKTLQGFANIRSGISSLSPLFTDPSQLSRGDLTYLPKQGSQTSGKIYACWGAHFQSDDSRVPSHMWCDLNLTKPKGAWWILNKSEITLYSVNDYMFEIPENWANTYVGGRRLATGRYRDGGWGGLGPNLFAIAPWSDGNPPVDGTILQVITLLRYSSSHTEGSRFGTSDKMKNYSHSDEWSGAAWLTAGSREAVIFIGTKGIGKTWYGYSDGTLDTDSPPPFPHDDRGWWSERFESQIIFYKPADLAQVAQGSMRPYEPQPYATMNLDAFLYNIDKVVGLPRHLQKHRLGACAYDRKNRLLYIFEYRGDKENDRPLVHVFKINE